MLRCSEHTAKKLWTEKDVKMLKMLKISTMALELLLKKAKLCSKIPEHLEPDASAKVRLVTSANEVVEFAGKIVMAVNELPGDAEVLAGKERQKRLRNLPNDHL